MINISLVLKKLIAVILFAVSFIVPGSPDKVDISVNTEETEKQIITAEWKNNTGKAIAEIRFYVEKNEDGEWTEIPFSPYFGFPEIYTQYYPTEGGKISIGTEEVFGTKLSSGEYRIILYYNVLYCSTNSGKASADFIIR